MRTRRRLATLGAILLGGTLLAGCAKARHVAVLADATFAQSVFAVDDAEFEACKTHIAPFTVDVCAATDPKIKAALLDVKAVTAALQATPNAVTVPTNLPSLLKNLTDVQAILSPLEASGTKQDIAAKIAAALTKAIAVINAFTTGAQ